MDEAMATTTTLRCMYHNWNAKERLDEYVPSHLRGKGGKSTYTFFDQHRHILDAKGYGADVVAEIETPMAHFGSVDGVLTTAPKVPRACKGPQAPAQPAPKPR